MKGGLLKHHDAEKNPKTHFRLLFAIGVFSMSITRGRAFCFLPLRLTLPPSSIARCRCCCRRLYRFSVVSARRFGRDVTLIAAGGKENSRPRRRPTIFPEGQN